jgi:hypothetical protein
VFGALAKNVAMNASSEVWSAPLDSHVVTLEGGRSANSSAIFKSSASTIGKATYRAAVAASAHGQGTNTADAGAHGHASH